MRPSLLAAVATAFAAWTATRALLPPPTRLHALIHAEPDEGPGHVRPGRLLPLVLPALAGGDAGGLERRLRQAGLTRGRSPAQVAWEHVSRVVGMSAAHGLALGGAVLAMGGGAGRATAAALLGALAGAARQQATVDRAVEARRERLRVELYTVNQLLMLDVRAGGGVAQALDRVARRADGVLAEELRDVLAAVRAGLPLDRALEQAAQATPEPAAARTYRLLSKGARFGTDLAAGLRALNEDLRVQRAEAIERAATKRRAAMLLPIIGLLAPVMLLFIAAPLPSILFGTR